MRSKPIVYGLALSALLAFGIIAAAERSASVTLVLPAGDAGAGREAFVALSCAACHRVAGDSELPDPVSANPGPTLGRYQATKGSEQLGLSIFAPSHEISATLHEQEDTLSPMGDYSEAMTIRQFIDIIAYIRSLES